MNFQSMRDVLNKYRAMSGKITTESLEHVAKMAPRVMQLVSWGIIFAQNDEPYEYITQATLHSVMIDKDTDEETELPTVVIFGLPDSTLIIYDQKHGNTVLAANSRGIMHFQPGVWMKVIMLAGIESLPMMPDAVKNKIIENIVALENQIDEPIPGAIPTA
jgi:hypothetical protein